MNKARSDAAITAEITTGANTSTWPPNRPISLLRAVAVLSLPIACCLFLIDQTQTSDFYTNSDALYFPRLIEDVIQRPWGLDNWIFQPDPDLVPSIPIYLLAYLVSFDFRGAIIVSAVIQTCLFFGIGVVLYRHCRPSGRPLVWIICFIAVLTFLLNVDRLTLGLSYPIAVYAWLLSMFLLNHHFGSLMSSLLCLYLTDRALRERLYPNAAAILVCSILFGVSDYIFLLIFTAPMVVILLWLLLASDIKRRCLVSSVAVAGGGVAAFLLGRLVNHTVDDYLRPFHLGLMRQSLRALAAVFWKGGPEPLGLVILAANLALALYAAIIIRRSCRRARPRPIDDIPFLDICVVNAAGATAAVTIAVVLNGMFINEWSLRYFNCAVFMPAIVAAILMAAWVEDLVAGWNATRRELALSIAAALAVVGSVVVAAGTRIDLKAPNEAILKCLARDPVVAGMADYWNASPLIMFSRWKYQIVQIDRDGNPSLWMTDRAWVNHDWQDATRVPRYSFIVMKNLWPDQIVDAYGRPDRLVKCGDGTEIWFYTDTEELSSRLLRRSDLR